MSDTPTPEPPPTPASSSTPSTPATPTATPDNPAAPVAPGTVDLKPNLAATITCVFPIVGSIVFLVLEKRNKFVRFWAMQSLLFGLLAFAFSILFQIAHFVFGHLPLIHGIMNFLLWIIYWAFEIGWVVVYIVCIIKAFNNQEWEIPWLGKIARHQLAKTDGTDGADLPAA